VYKDACRFFFRFHTLKFCWVQDESRGSLRELYSVKNCKPLAAMKRCGSFEAWSCSFLRNLHKGQGLTGRIEKNFQQKCCVQDSKAFLHGWRIPMFAIQVNIWVGCFWRIATLSFLYNRFNVFQNFRNGRHRHLSHCWWWWPCCVIISGCPHSVLVWLVRFSKAQPYSKTNASFDSLCVLIPPRDPQGVYRPNDRVYS